MAVVKRSLRREKETVLKMVDEDDRVLLPIKRLGISNRDSRQNILFYASIVEIGIHFFVIREDSGHDTLGGQLKFQRRNGNPAPGMSKYENQHPTRAMKRGSVS